MTNPLDAVMEKVRNNIREHGVTVIAVGGDTVDGQPVGSFAYTVGLTEVGHPELMIAGLPFEISQALLNDAATRVRAGEHLSPGQRVDWLLRSYDVVVTDVVTAEVGVATRLYDRDIVVRQLVWPDKAGHYPWDEDYGYPAWGQRDVWIVAP